MGDAWSVVSERDEPIEVTRSDGRTIRLNRGDEFSTPSACEVIEFLNRRDPNIPYRDRTNGWLNSLLEAGRADGCVGPDGEFMGTPGAGTSTTRPPSQPPSDGDSADGQGAPNVPPGVQLNGA